MSDFEIINEIKKNNQQVFSNVYKKYRDEFCARFRQGIDEDNVIDAYQEACVALWRNIQNEKLTAESLNVKLKTYLFDIGHKKIVDYFRKSKTAKKTQFIENIDYSKEYSSESIDADVNNERERVVRKAVDAMTEPCHSILILFYWEKKKMDEIAEQLDYSNAASAKTQKNKCMNKLTSYIKTLLS